jgi:type II protein arginine methyltransferase
LAAAVARYQDSDLLTAAEGFRAVLALEPTNAIASHQLGLMAFAEGDHEASVAHLRRAAESDPENAEYRNNLGVVLNATGQTTLARDAFEQALMLDGASAHGANNLGSMLEKLGDDSGAIALYHRALRLDPAFVEARDNLVLACARVAPPWHFPMMADAPRNRAYADALRRAAPGRRVLDIGSGAGLLSMMAAEAGAECVNACEMAPVIAAAARVIIDANNLSDRVTLHAKRSDQLEIGRELPARADLLVTEIFASGLLSEYVLPTLEDARQRLLTADATIIPRRATALGYLIGGETIEGQLFASSSAGFDLSAFDRLAPVKLGLHLDRLPHLVMSDDFEILALDLTLMRFAPERRSLRVVATAGGRCVGVAQWLRLDLDPHTQYENRPDAEAGANGWMHVIYRFPEAIDLAPGQEVELIGSHNRTAMTVALASVSEHRRPE